MLKAGNEPGGGPGLCDDPSQSGVARAWGPWALQPRNVGAARGGGGPWARVPDAPLPSPEASHVPAALGGRSGGLVGAGGGARLPGCGLGAPLPQGPRLHGELPPTPLGRCPSLKCLGSPWPGRRVGTPPPTPALSGACPLARRTRGPPGPHPPGRRWPGSGAQRGQGERQPTHRRQRGLRAGAMKTPRPLPRDGAGGCLKPLR